VYLLAFKDSTVSVEAKGLTLTQKVSDGINVEITENVITLTRSSNSKDQRADHGFYRSLISNMVFGLSDGWSKKLELVGVGFRANHRGQVLDLALGFSHNISIQIPLEVKVNTISEKG
jgi:large subunit ribosomal protein L6